MAGGGKGDPELSLGSVKLEQFDFQVEKLRRHFGVQGRVHLGGGRGEDGQNCSQVEREMEKLIAI